MRSLPACAAERPGTQLIHLLVDDASAADQRQRERVLRDVGAVDRVEGSELREEGRRAVQVAGLIDGVADPADLERARAFHATHRHLLGRPELELVAIGIGEPDGRSVLALVRRGNGVCVGHAVLVEPSQVLGDILLADEEANPGKHLARRGDGGRISFWRKPSTMEYGVRQNTMEGCPAVAPRS